MRLSPNLLAKLDALGRRFGVRVVDSGSLYDWQARPRARAGHNPCTPPAEAVQYLRADHQKLKELEARYERFDKSATTPLVWTNRHVKSDDILYFRGDNAYVWQKRGDNMNDLGYALATYYVKSIDTLKLFDALGEDDAFGNYTFTIDHRLVSRDLLDSMIEMYFLERHLKLSAWEGCTLLDIGSGYGRLAHRMVTAFRNIDRYLCADAVAVSTFIADYYLRFRAVDDRAKVVALDLLEQELASRKVDIAMNIHSFSECQITAIDWWVALLRKHRVRYLMIVPNADDHGGRILRTCNGKDFAPVVEKHGYRLIAMDAKYGDPMVQRYAINPTHHHLYELRPD